MISLLSPGTMLQNRYLIQHVLGQGGMGAVYLALDYRLGQTPVAVKENFDTSPQALAQFQREASLLERLCHPSFGGNEK
jgi:serine/threonine protein kinase